jgi:hypothetical protein
MSAKDFGRLLGGTARRRDYDVHPLAEIGDTAGQPLRLRVVRNRDGSWKTAA